MLKKLDNLPETKLNLGDISLPLSSLGLDSHNNSHYFLLPFLDLPEFPSINGSYVNTYIGDRGRVVEIEGCIYMLFQFPDFDCNAYHLVQKTMLKCPQFKFSYYAGISKGKNLVMYVMKVDESNRELFDLAVAGKYSQLGNDYMMMVERFPYRNYNKKGMSSLNKPICDFLKKIINKDPSFKETMEEYLGCKIHGELWNTFEDFREVFRHE